MKVERAAVQRHAEFVMQLGPHRSAPEPEAQVSLGPSQHSKSILRMLPILEAFERRKRGKLPVLGVKEIADELGMPKGTVHRYLTSLVAAGWVERVDRRYVLSGTRLRAMKKAGGWR